MAINKPSLASALKSVGVAGVYVGDPFTASGLSLLGTTEGDISFNPDFQTNPLTAPEQTGTIPHDVKVMAGAATLTVPLIVGDEALWAKIMPSGTKGAGWSSQKTVTTTSVVVVPLDEVTDAGMSYDGTTWSPAEPVNALWLWKAYPVPGELPYRFGDGGKVIITVTFNAMFYAANPEGHKVWTVGNPVDQGITTVRV